MSDDVDEMLRAIKDLSGWSSDALHNLAKWEPGTARGKAARAHLAEREQRVALPPPPVSGPAASERLLAWVSRLAEAVHYDTYGTGTMTARDCAKTLLAAVGPPPSNEPGEPQ